MKKTYSKPLFDIMAIAQHGTQSMQIKAMMLIYDIIRKING